MQSMNEEQLQAYARALAELYEQAELELLEVTARRLARGIDQPGWAEAKLAEIQQLRAHHASILDKYLKGAEELVEAGMKLAYDSGAPPIFQSPVQIRTNQEAVQALIKETTAKLQSSGVQILRQAEDIYRGTLADALRLSVSGVLTRRQATARALEDFAAKGISGFTDSRGRNWEISSYAEMAARTGYMRANLAGNLSRYSSEGRDLVIISVSPEPCPICDPYEGHIFSISGASRQYPHLQQAIGGGLFHANCTHRATPYIPGLTRTVTPQEKYNKQGENKYPERQQQRALERQIRKYKRLQAAALTPEDAAKWGKKLRGAQSNLSGFIRDTGRLRQRHREQLFDAVRARRQREERLSRRAAQQPQLDPLVTDPEPPKGHPAKIAQAWAEYHYPETAWDIAGIDDHAAEDVMVELHRLAQEWPEVIRQIKYIGTQGPGSPYPWDWESSPGSYAHMARDNSFMGLNPKFFGPGKYQATLDQKAKDVLAGWTTGGFSSADGIRAIITHEYGHAVDNWLRTSKDMILPYGDISIGYMDVGSITNYWHQQRNKRYTPKSRAKALSQYAVYKPNRNSTQPVAESWAESFTLQYWPRAGKKPGTYQQSQKKLLEVLHPSRRLKRDAKPEDYTWTTDLPYGDERNAARGKIAALMQLLDLY